MTAYIKIKVRQRFFDIFIKSGYNKSNLKKNMHYPFEKKYNEKQLQTVNKQFVEDCSKEFGDHSISSLEFVKIFD